MVKKGVVKKEVISNADTVKILKNQSDRLVALEKWSNLVADKHNALMSDVSAVKVNSNERMDKVVGEFTELHKSITGLADNHDLLRKDVTLLSSLPNHNAVGISCVKKHSEKAGLLATISVALSVSAFTFALGGGFVGALVITLVSSAGCALYFHSK